MRPAWCCRWILLELSTRDTSRQWELEAGVSRLTTARQLRRQPGAHRVQHGAGSQPRLPRALRHDGLDPQYGHDLCRRRSDYRAGRPRRGETTDFAEVTVNLSGQWHDSPDLHPQPAARLELERIQHRACAGPAFTASSRFNWQKQPNSWRTEIGVDAYDYDGLPSPVRTYAVVEIPLNRRLNLGFEVSVENNYGPSNAWVFLRVPMKVPMKWRPTQGALTGRVSGGGAPLPGALAELGGKRAITTSDGSFVRAGPASRPLPADRGDCLAAGPKVRIGLGRGRTPRGAQGGYHADARPLAVAARHRTRAQRVGWSRGPETERIGASRSTSSPGGCSKPP